MQMTAEMELMEETLPRKYSRDGRDALRRLFQSYVSDFGPSIGEQIIRTIIDTMGGHRMIVPKDNKSVGVRCYCNGTEALMQCYEVMSSRLNSRDIGKVVMMRLVKDLGGLRLVFPDYEELYREERNRKIHAAYNGFNIAELAIIWGLRERTIRNILREE